MNWFKRKSHEMSAVGGVSGSGGGGGMSYAQENSDDFSLPMEMSAFDRALAENQAKLEELTNVIEARRHVLSEEVTPPMGIPTAQLLAAVRKVLAEHGRDCAACKELADLIGQ